MAQGSPRRDAGRALQGGLLFLLSFLVLTVIVTQDRLAHVDLAARSLVYQSHHPSLLSFMAGASYLGGQPGQVAVLVVGFAILWPRRRRWAMALPLVVAGAGVAQYLAKWSADRPRPNLEAWGFPSAHVLSLVVLCGYLAYAVSIGCARRRRRLGVGACALIVGTVAYSRMYLDAHWLSDILGGFAGGFAYLLVAIWLVESAPRLRRALRSTHLARGADGGLLIPAPVGLSVDLVVVPAATGPEAPEAS
jgi:membrane-associated phospholipid phosphatase